MRLRAFMIKLEYSEEQLTKKINKKQVLVPAELKEITPEDEDYPEGEWRLGWEYYDRHFVTQNHFGKGITVMAFQLDPEGQGRVEDYALGYAAAPYDKLAELELSLKEYQYLEDRDIFLALPVYNWKKAPRDSQLQDQYDISNSIEEAVPGSIIPGDFYVFLRNKASGELLKEYRVTAWPSSINLPDYEAMVNDILSIKRQLLIAQQSTSTIQYKSVGAYLEQVKEALSKLEQPLKQIAAKPKTAIVENNVSRSLTKVKKFDDRFFREYLANPGKEKYTTVAYSNDSNIYENRIIKSALANLKENLQEVYEDQEWQRKDKLQSLQTSLEDFRKMYPGLRDQEINSIYASQYNNSANAVLRLLKDKYLTWDNEIEHRTDKSIRVKVEVSIIDKGDLNRNYSTYLRMHFVKGVLKCDYTKGITSYNYLIKDKILKLTKYTILDEMGNPQIDTMGNAKTIFIIKNAFINLDFCCNDFEYQYWLYEAISRGSRFTLDCLVRCDNPGVADPLNVNKSGNYYDYNYDLHVVEIKQITAWGIGKFADAESLDLAVSMGNLFLNYGKVESSVNSFKLSYKNWHWLNEKWAANSVENSREAYGELEAMLSKYLSLPLLESLNGKEAVLKPTQIFLNDSRYKAVYKILNNLNQKYAFIQQVDKNLLLVNKIDKLYEYWLLIKISALLQTQLKWQTDPANSLLGLIDNILTSKHQDTDGIRMRFFLNLPETYFVNREGNREKLAARTLCCEVLYNQRVAYVDEQGKNRFKQPDFWLRFGEWKTDNGTFVGNPFNIYLDAKYKKFADLGHINGLANEIYTVAIEKYVESFKSSTEAKASASFIIHTDASNQRYRFWGSHYREDIFKAMEALEHSDEKIIADYGNPQHITGAFVMLPHNSEDFITFMKMVMEYHFLKYTVANNRADLQIYKRLCCECGGTDVLCDPKATISDFTKYHMTCRNPECGNFWVKNHCKDSRGAHSLFKHYIHNFQEPMDGDLWYLRCPVCDYNG